MKHLIIIGAGGMGRCVYNLAINSIGYGTEFDVKGFLEIDRESLNGFEGYPPILSDDDHYEICENDVFVCSLGEAQKRKEIYDRFIAKGAHFMTLIHKNATIGTNTKIGLGTIIDESAHIDPDVTIGCNCLIQVQAILGHDSVIGNHVRIDSQAFMVGGTIIGSGACIYTKAMINHNVEIGENAVVGACSFVIKKVKSGTTVFGSPAKSIF